MVSFCKMRWVDMQKCASHRGQEACFPKSGQKLEKKVLTACGADVKERMARAIRKMKFVLHAAVFPVGLLETTNAREWSESMFFKRPMERNKNELSEQRRDRSEQSEVNGSFPSAWGSKKRYF